MASVLLFAGEEGTGGSDEGFLPQTIVDAILKSSTTSPPCEKQPPPAPRRLVCGQEEYPDSLSGDPEDTTEGEELVRASRREIGGRRSSLPGLKALRPRQDFRAPPALPLKKV